MLSDSTPSREKDPTLMAASGAKTAHNRRPRIFIRAANDKNLRHTTTFDCKLEMLLLRHFIGYYILFKASLYQICTAGQLKMLIAQGLLFLKVFWWRVPHHITIVSLDRLHVCSIYCTLRTWHWGWNGWSIFNITVISKLLKCILLSIFL